ncbi:MAG: hypothetical protein ACI8UQ_000132, partial [Bacteroidia bacterium]
MSTDLFEVRLQFKKLVPETPEQLVESVKIVLVENQDKIVGRI